MVAMLLFVLILFTALAIDTTMLASSKSKQRHIAQYMALAAVKAFGTTPGDNTAKLQAALDRAREFADDNTFISQAFMIPEPKSIGTNRAVSPAATHGLLVPGIWYFQPQPALCAANLDPRLRPCPCASPPSVKTPCFRPLNFDLPSEATEVPNAVSVQIWTSATSPVRTIFARVQGLDNYTLGGQATAAITPRHGIFLLDLSRSAHAENYLPFETAANPPANPNYNDAAEFAYRLTGVSGGGACTVGTNPCAPPGVCVPGAPAPYPPPNGCTIPGGVIETLFQIEYNEFLRNCRQAPPPLRPPERHYKTDYSCYPISYTDDGTPRNDDYLIDGYRGDTTAGTFRGPEPLSTMLDGLHYALERVQTASVPGDLMGVIGFDMSAKINIRQMNPSPSTDARYSGFLTASNMTLQSPADLANRFQNYGLFTRMESQANFPEALREARAKLRAANNSESAENFVVMMSDGLTSCYRNRTCGPDEKHFLNSQAEAMDILEHDYVGDRTRFHFILLGNEVGPHTILTTKEENGVRTCMTEEQADLNNPPLNFVNASVPPGATSADPSPRWYALANGTTVSTNLKYFAPNGFYRSVKATQGLWFPIRQCCRSTAGAACDAPSVVQGALQTACQNTAPGILGGTTNQPIPAIASPYTDGEGRLLCDSEGRDRTTQIHEAVDKIFVRSPYTLVQ